MTSARWLGVAVIAVAITACGDDVSLEDGEGGSGGEGPATGPAATGPSASSGAAPASSVSSGDVVVGQGGGGGDGGSGEGGTTDPYVPPEGGYEACVAYWEPIIDLFVECYGGTGAYLYGGPDIVDRLADNCARIIYRGGQSVAAQQACADDAAAIDSCEAFDAFFNVGTEACAATLHGDGAVGDACMTGYECASSACYVAPNETCGTCRPAGADGDACDGADTLCGPYLYCIEGSCRPRLTLGEACDLDTPCETGISCVQGECAAPIPEGGTCDPQAATYECIRGTYCNAETDTCDLISTADLGETCGLLEDGTLGLCNDNLRCRVTSGQTGTCVEAIEDGEACSPNAPIIAGNECAQPATCVDFECAIRADALSCF